MQKRRGLRALVLTAMSAGLLFVPGQAQTQAPSTAIEFVFSGVADVAPGIFLPGLDSTSNTSWGWSFTSSLTCQGAGVSGGAPAAGACLVTGSGPLRGDLTNAGQPLAGLMKDAPYCGNSTGFTDSARPASIQDPSGRIWTGEIHWDGVGRGDPSYSAGSQLLLFGTVSSGAETAEIILFLNASGGSNCVPQISPTGATSFTVNGTGSLRTRV